MDDWLSETGTHPHSNFIICISSPSNTMSYWIHHVNL